MEKAKILIINFESELNKGSLALLKSTMKAIEAFIPNTEFTLLPYELDYQNDEIKMCKLRSKISIRKPQYTIISLAYVISCMFIRILEELNISPPIPRDSVLFEYYNADIVINTGGDTMTGAYGYSSFTPMINILYAILLKKPVVLFGESLGPFNKSIIYLIAKFILNKTKLILLRENLSLKYLKDVGITKPKIFVTADPAFLLSAASQPHVYQILSNENMNIKDTQKFLIGVNPSRLIGKYYPKGEEYLTNILARAIDNLVENLNVTVLLIPHVYGPTTETDDRIAANMIFAKVKNKTEVKIVKNEYSPEELKGIIGLCDLFIGARMHSTIASTSMSVPTVGIAYSHKMYAIIGDMVGQERYILDIKELDYESLISKINDAWGNREKIKKGLEMKIPMVKESAMLNGKLVKELLDTIKSREEIR
jgi:polysaccharide pyruvyl transferase WcaK-like protein